MIDFKDQMESPSGLDLNPSPPPTARISKKVGLVVMGTVLLVGVLVVYGLYTRKEQQTVARQAAEEKHPEPARIAGDQVVREIAPPAVANPPLAAGPPEFDSARTGSAATEPTMLRPPSITRRRDRPPGRKSTPSYASSEAELSPEERLRLAAFREEQQAVSSPTEIRGNSHTSSPASSSVDSDPLRQYASLASLIAGAGKQGSAGQDVQSPPSGPTGSSYDDQNRQSQKESFFQKAHGVDDYQKSSRTEPLSRYEIKAGWDIPATLEQAIDSDLPGEVKALVRSNVYDTASASISRSRKVRG